MRLWDAGSEDPITKEVGQGEYPDPERSSRMPNLADFGLSTTVRTVPRTSANARSHTSQNSLGSKVPLVSYVSGGTRRWMGPEILWPGAYGSEES